MTTSAAAAQSRLDEILETAPPTTDARSQRMLAVALGYPSTWHVVRLPDSKMDIIYAANPAKHKNVALWFHHHAARKAASEWDPDTSSPFQNGHLLPRKPKFKKNDAVEVLYEEEWYAATIVKRKDYEDEYRYTVLYTDEGTEQEEVEEEDIRPAPPDAEAMHLAATLGFPKGWKATTKGKRYTITSPDGIEFKNKKAAFVYLDQLSSMDGGDPPWRTSGHKLLNKRVEYTSTHRMGSRHVFVKQTGTIKGWISATDKDKQGEPGYVSDQTGEPADLFHIVFDDEPHHPYAKLLIESMDMEENEVMGSLLDGGGGDDDDDDVVSEPPSKRAKTES